MKQLEPKKCNTILLEKLQKYQNYYMVTSIKNEYLTGDEKVSPDQKKIIEQVKKIEQVRYIYSYTS